MNVCFYLDDSISYVIYVSLPTQQHRVREAYSLAICCALSHWAGDLLGGIFLPVAPSCFRVLTGLQSKQRASVYRQVPRLTGDTLSVKRLDKSIGS